ncbi:lycopene cyclase domain-containing protein [Maribellus sediminis]|uniref:lycopene cyclase domain-containing protein n=1 Tax=Maribellus sediminis TaxID=2696285 RepID=UPI0014309FC8|nr:lycopene cyclase domain-containing protein [Maribellus sediminis]
MGIGNFIYVILLAAVTLATAGISIWRRDGYIGQLKYILPAMIFPAVIFIIWDMRFTEIGIWTFNPKYILGETLNGLPIEEWLFFFVVPFFSLYIYEILQQKLIRFNQPNIFVALTLVLLVVFALIAYFYRKNLYTFFTFFLLTIYFGYTTFRNNFKKNFPKFYLSYVAALVPFLILRGILTALPVISFNSEHIINIHIFTVPVEDLAYFFLLHLMNITIFEYLKIRRFF